MVCVPSNAVFLRERERNKKTPKKDRKGFWKFSPTRSYLFGQTLISELGGRGIERKNKSPPSKSKSMAFYFSFRDTVEPGNGTPCSVSIWNFLYFHDFFLSKFMLIPRILQYAFGKKKKKLSLSKFYFSCVASVYLERVGRFSILFFNRRMIHEGSFVPISPSWYSIDCRLWHWMTLMTPRHNGQPLLRFSNWML